MTPTPGRTLLPFLDLRDAPMRVRVEPDPLGPVNKIVTLMRGEHRLKSVLCPVPPGAVVRLARHAGSPYIRYWDSHWNPLGGEPWRSPGWHPPEPDPSGWSSSPRSRSAEYRRRSSASPENRLLPMPLRYARRVIPDGLPLGARLPRATP